MLVVEPTKRMSIPEILQSKWVRSADQDEIEGSDEEENLFFESHSFGGNETNLNAILNGGITNRSNQSQNTVLCSERSINPMQQQGNVNEINIGNLIIKDDDVKGTFARPAQDAKLSYSNYCAITQDFGTH